MDLLARKRISELAFDKTISPCKVLNHDAEDESKYLVQYETAIFDAYVQNTSTVYYEGDSVYVLIPSGDWNNTKMITGRCTTTEGTKYYNFKFPLEDFIAIDELIWTTDVSGVGFIANKEFSQELNGDELFGASTNHYYYIGSCVPSTGEEIALGDAANQLGVSMDVTAYLSGYNLSSGKYGIFIIARGKTESGETDYGAQWFTSKDMYGNPYAFVSATRQEKLLQFNGLVSLDKIEVWAWQDRDFRDSEGNLIDVAKTENIFLNNIKLSIGAVAAKETLQLYTYEGTNYGTSPSNAVGKNEEELEKSYKKTLRVSWATMIDNNLKVFNEYNLNNFNEYNYKIRWYHKVPNTLFYDSYGGENWELLDIGNESSVKATLIISKREKLINSAKGYTGQSVAAKAAWSAQLSQIMNNTALTNEQKMTAIAKSSSLNTSVISKEDVQAIYDIVKEYCDPTTQAKINAIDQGADELVNVDLDEIYGDYAPVNRFSRSVTLEPNKATEVYKVIVFYNGTTIESNELVLENAAYVINAEDDAAVSDNIILRVYRPLLKKLNEKNDKWGHNCIASDANANFFCYTDNNTEIANADGVLPSEIVYPIQIFIRDTEDGSFKPLTAEDYQVGSIKWQCYPDSLTMPSMISDFYTLAESNEIFDSYNFDVANGERSTVAFFEINKVYRPTKTNNTITVSFIRGGALYRISKTLQFGHQSTNGTRYTAAINILDPDDGDYIPLRGAFTLQTTVYDGVTGEVVNPLLLNYTWRFIDGDDAADSGTYTITEQQPTGRIICNSNAADGNLLPPIVECQITGLPDISYALTVRKGLAITDSEFASITNIYCPDRIQFNSDGSKPLYQRDVFKVYDTEDEEFIYPAWTMNFNPYFCLNTSLADTTRSMYVGDDQVEETDIVAETEVDAEIAEDFLSAAEAFYSVSAQDGTAYGQTYDELTGQLDEAESIDPDFTEIDVLDETCPISYRLVPKSANIQWEYGMDNTYLYVSFTLSNGTYFAQAIVLDQNAYVSSLVNQWDGKSLVLDEENSLLMSNMLAVGTKDRNNKFTGIMMGDWTGNDDGSMDVPGLYGYQQGAQSFGLLTTGQAFLGQYGKGRIFFDGNYALISNADKTSYINLNPAPGTWGSHPAKSTGPSSSYFLYSQVAKLSTLNDDDDEQDENGYTNHQKHEAFKQWYNQFASDTAHDYFIVDPNRGILTTGGVGADWGYIGKWTIDSGYLSYSDAQEGHFMYLGRPSTKDETGVDRPYMIEAGTAMTVVNEDGTAVTVETTNFGVDDSGFMFSQSGMIGGFVITPDNLSGFDENYDIKIQLNPEGQVNLGNVNKTGDAWAISIDATSPDSSAVKLRSGECTLELGDMIFASETNQIFNSTYNLLNGDENGLKTGIITLGNDQRSITAEVALGNAASLAEVTLISTGEKGFSKVTVGSTAATVELLTGDITKETTETIITPEEELNQEQVKNGEAASNFATTTETSSEVETAFILQPTKNNYRNVTAYLKDWVIDTPSISGAKGSFNNLNANDMFLIKKNAEGGYTSDAVAGQNWVDARILYWMSYMDKTIQDSEEFNPDEFDTKFASLWVKFINYSLRKGFIHIDPETGEATVGPADGD